MTEDNGQVAQAQLYIRILEQRIAWLETAVVRLAEATQGWQGGTNQGVVYCNAQWREQVRQAVAR